MNIAVLVSGGVDSSVALKLLQDQGHTVTAFYLKIWLEDELSYLGDCPWQEDLNYVQAVCAQLNVPLRIISLQKEYNQTIIAYTINEIKQGRTPNPDVFCNKQIKFGLFFNHIDSSFDKVATGHYAQLHETPQGLQLVMAPDAIKDQTYFLSYLSKEQLKRIIFPIGHLNKEQVRACAAEFNLPNKDRKDSQGICFLGKLKFSDFIKHHVGEKSGDLIEYETEKKLGTHKGFWYFTIGQRQGSGLSGGPWYVVAKDTKLNKVFVSRQYYTTDKQRTQFKISNCNWLEPIADKKNIQVKLRHAKHINACTIEPLSSHEYRVTLQTNDQGIAPGQFAVFYQDNVCLGAGIIDLIT
jgi:tRNA (5-methylaminomethyl-2-thiouridylate)-methyltransferase